MISEISPFKDFVCIKVCHNRRVRCFGIVLVCPCLYTNRTSKELQTLLSLFFFSKFELPNRGCGLSTGAAYLRVRLIHGTLRYFVFRCKHGNGCVELLQTCRERQCCQELKGYMESLPSNLVLRELNPCQAVLQSRRA